MKRWGAKTRTVAALLVCASVSVLWITGTFDQIVSLVEDKQAERVLRAEDEVAFKRWLAGESLREAKFAAFSVFLRQNKVDDVVPLWTLTRGDVNRLPWCANAGFRIPPRKYWPNIVPALRLIRTHVIPTVGRIEVRSGFRAADLNRCANGASQSRHLSYAALDLVARDQPDGRTLFSKLCTRWRNAGPKSRWGLGAYFDPNRPLANRQARFHVDATGWRSWGFSKKSASSGCSKLET